MSQSKHLGLVLLFLAIAVALSGCLGTSKSITVQGLENQQLQVGEKKAIPIEVEPADTTFQTTSTDSAVATAEIKDGQLVIEAISEGTTTILLTAQKEGHQDNTSSFRVQVGSSRIIDARLSEHLVDQELIVEVDTINLADDTLITVELLDADKNTVAEQTGTIKDDFTTLSLELPFDFVEAYEVRVTVDGIEDAFITMYEVPSGDASEDLHISAQLVEPGNTVAGEEFGLTLDLAYKGIPAPDGEYTIAIFSDLDGSIFEEQAVTFTNGQADISLSPLTTAGEHELTVETQSSSDTFKLTVLAGELSSDDEPVVEQDLQVSIQLAEPGDTVAGEEFRLTLCLDYEDIPAPDGEYTIAIFSDLDGSIFEEQAVTFTNGQADISPSPLTTAGEHELTVETQSSSDTFKLTVLAGELSSDDESVVEQDLQVSAQLVEPGDTVAGEEFRLTLYLDYKGIPAPDGEYAIAIFSDLDGFIFEEQAVTFTNGQADISPSPLTTAGEHELSVETQSSSDTFKLTVLAGELSSDDEPVVEQDLQVSVQLAEPGDTVAGEEFRLTLYLDYKDIPAPDGEYAIAIFSDLDGSIFEEQAVTFTNGQADVSPSPLTTAGEHELSVETQGSFHSVPMSVLTAEPVSLRLLDSPGQGIAAVPIPAPTLALFDQYENMITESDLLIDVTVPGGFASGSECITTVATSFEGLAKFMDLILYEGEYTMTFSHQDLEVAYSVFIAPEGNGTADYPYLIRNVSGLKTVRDDVNAHYQLASDIDVAANGEPWEPIAGFAGRLDGNFHSINNLFIDAGSANNIGLFSTITRDGYITNLNLFGAQIFGGNNVGAFAGQNAGIIQGVTVDGGSIQGSNSVGGLVGANSGTITASRSLTDVTANAEAGGLAGYNSGTIERSFSHARTVASNFNVYAGGLVGRNRGTIHSSYARGQVQASSAGGLVGHNQNNNNGMIIKSYAATSIKGTGNLGGLTSLNLGLVEESFFDSTVSETNYGSGTPKTTRQMKEKDTYLGWDFSDTWDMDTWDMDEFSNDGYPFLRAVK